MVTRGRYGDSNIRGYAGAVQKVNSSELVGSTAHKTNMPPSQSTSEQRKTTELNILQFLRVSEVLRRTPCLTDDIVLTVDKHSVQ